MQIDQENGSVRFPNGQFIGPAITQDSFRATPEFSESRGEDCGTLPWIHYHFGGGQLDGKDLAIAVCFYGQILVSLRITVNFYTSENWSWSDYSLEVEAQTKHFHDRLLHNLLGKPTKGGSFILGRLPEGQETLTTPLDWQFDWGRVSSSHDSKGGGTFISIGYGNRHKEASVAYQRSQQSH